MKRDKGSCLECYRRLNELCLKSGAIEAGAKDARDWVAAAVANGTPQDVVEARHALATILMFGAANQNLKMAVEAQALFVTILSVNGADNQARFDLGRALAYLHRDLEASAEFEIYLEKVPETDPQRHLAQRFVKQPKLAANRILPPLHVKMPSGEVFDLASTRGNVMILDFWASWCPECKVSIPRLKNLTTGYRARKFSHLSVRIDEDRAKGNRAMDIYGMNWPQALDEDWTITNLLETDTVPRFLLIDTDGTVLYEGYSIEKIATHW